MLLNRSSIFFPVFSFFCLCMCIVDIFFKTIISFTFFFNLVVSNLALIYPLGLQFQYFLISIISPTYFLNNLNFFLPKFLVLCFLFVKIISIVILACVCFLHIHSCDLLFLFFVLYIYIYSNFRFTTKLRGRYRDLSYIPCHHACIASPLLTSPTRVVHLIKLMNLH